MNKRYSNLIENKWQRFWLENQIYKFNKKNLGTKPIFVIDSPPPFTSGEVHMGHVLSYSYFDFAARYKRMRGFEVFYPQGWDAQGFPTEVKVEKKYGKLTPEKFRQKCIDWSWQMIKKMKESMIKLGFSPDWSLEYITMLPEYHKLVQESIIEMYEKGYIYRDKHPVLWCPRCESAIAKAETEEKEEETTLYYFNFKIDDKNISIASTRPELLHACIAVMVHPEDERYKILIGKKAKTPFGKEIPIIGDKDVDMNFGTGIVMVCTYGDKMDVAWQKRYNLPLIKAFDEKGRIINSPFYDNLKYKDARNKVVNFLKEKKYLVKEEKIKHTIKIHDRCKHEIELLPSIEWFVNVRDNAKKIEKIAKEIKWVPEFGIHYLIDWLDNIDWDWVISRDRIFGTPIPFYICKNCGYYEPVEKEKLPFYPEKTEPRKCPKCDNKMEPETKVFDVWVDSSITPLIISGWKRDEELFKYTYPNTLRPQGVEIIRTWAFYTIFRTGVALTGKKPWSTILLNGNVLALDGRKMSKSLGNVIDPMKLLKEFPADAMRQWAAMSGAMAKDRPFSYEDIKFAKQFLNKYWNAFRFVERFLKNNSTEFKFKELRSVDRWIITRTSQIIEKITKAMDEYNYREAITTFHKFFWYELCDYYLEYVKWRVYSEGIEKDKAVFTLNKIFYALNKLFAPIAPHITEEIYHSIFDKPEENSIHLSNWPKPFEKDEKLVETFKVANEIMRRIREYKARNRMPMNAEISRIILYLNKKLNEDILEDIKKTGKIKELTVKNGDLNIEFI